MNELLTLRFNTPNIVFETKGRERGYRDLKAQKQVSETGIGTVLTCDVRSLIICIGPRLTIFLNGRVTAETTGA